MHGIARAGLKFASRPRHIALSVVRPTQRSNTLPTALRSAVDGALVRSRTGSAEPTRFAHCCSAFVSTSFVALPRLAYSWPIRPQRRKTASSARIWVASDVSARRSAGVRASIARATQCSRRVMPEVDRLLARDQRDALRLRLAMAEAGVRDDLLRRRQLEVRREPRPAREAPAVEARDAGSILRAQPRRVRAHVCGSRPARRPSGRPRPTRDRYENEQREPPDPPSPHTETLPHDAHLGAPGTQALHPGARSATTGSGPHVAGLTPSVGA